MEVRETPQRGTIIATLRKTPLFTGITADEIGPMLDCLAARTQPFAKGAYLIRRGQEVGEIGVVVSGSVHIVMEDYWGNRNILGHIGPGQMFGEAYACMPGVPARVDAVAIQKGVAIFLDVGRIMTTCTSACDFHIRVVRNLLTILARKNLALTDKVAHVTKRSVRDKILSYLSAESLSRGSASFDIPFNRQQLADYLSVERSALSTGLGKLRDDGLITFEKNHFELH